LLMDEAEIKQIAEQISNHITDELNKCMKDLQPKSLDRLLYTSGEMAKMCGVHKNTWCVWVRKGVAPQPVDIGGARRWLAADIQKWENKLKRSSNVVLRAARKD